MSQTIDAPPVARLDSLMSNERSYEIVNGQEVELPPMSAFESLLSFRIAKELDDAAEDRGLGQAVMEMLFRFGPNRPQRKPDAAYVSFQRWPRQRRVPRQNAWAVVPELIVEVISPSDNADAVIDRVTEFFGSGVSMVWVVWPTVKQVYIYTSPTQVRIIEVGGELDAEPLLPGWRWPVAELFGPDDEEPASIPAANGDS
jgi:Uma2 family endonuclease